MSSLGCDMFAAGCHKWIFGPRGTGVLCANPAAWSVASRAIPSVDRMWRAGPEMPAAAWMPPGGFHSFEHRWALGEAFRFHQAIGKARVARRIHELNEQCKQGLAKIPRVTVHTPLSSDVAAGIVCFQGASPPPYAGVGRLPPRKKAARGPPPGLQINLAGAFPGLRPPPADAEAS